MLAPDIPSLYVPPPPAADSIGSSNNVFDSGFFTGSRGDDSSPDELSEITPAGTIMTPVDTGGAPAGPIDNGPGSRGFGNFDTWDNIKGAAGVGGGFLGMMAPGRSVAHVGRSLRLYANFYGNGSTYALRALKVAEVTAIPILALSIVLDVANPKKTTLEVGRNAAVGAGLIILGRTGPAGATASAVLGTVYFDIEALYPHGVTGYVNDYTAIQLQTFQAYGNFMPAYSIY